MTAQNQWLFEVPFQLSADVGTHPYFSQEDELEYFFEVPLVSESPYFSDFEERFFGDPSQGKDNFIKLAEQARKKFGIPGLGEKSGSLDTDGWPKGKSLKHVALTVNGKTIPESIIQIIEKHEQRVLTHVKKTLELFARETNIQEEEIDLSLVLATAVRESRSQRILVPSPKDTKTVITTGQDNHPDGVAGLDNIFKHRNLFPKSIRHQIKLVAEGLKRPKTQPANLPEKYLLAAFIVKLAYDKRRFEEEVKRIFGNRTILSTLNRDARRAWILLGFAGVGHMSKVLKNYKSRIDRGIINDLNAIIFDKDLKDTNFHVRVAVVTSARAWMLDQSLPNEIITLPKQVFDAYKGFIRPSDYSCVMPRTRDFELESEPQFCKRVTIGDKPTPCQFYTIKHRIDAKGLIDLAGRAYGIELSSQKVKLAQWINNHPYNRRFWKANLATGDFPQGRISFNPTFSSDIDKQARAIDQSPSGNAFATIFIPPPPSWLRRTFPSCKN